MSDEKEARTANCGDPVEAVVMWEHIDIENAVKYLCNYMNTYDKQYGYKNYLPETFINDILYGLGVSIDKNKFSFANGYADFREKLRRYLDT